MAEPHELTAEECDRILRSGILGRVAIATPTGPHIVPVNYAVVGDAVVFRTSPYSVVGTYGLNAPMAFEVDHVDYEYATGWSVLVRGRSEPVTDAAEVRRIHEGWSPHPWAAGSRNLYLALRWREISGRRLGLVLDVRRDLPVDRRVPGL